KLGYAVCSPPEADLYGAIITTVKLGGLHVQVAAPRPTTSAGEIPSRLSSMVTALHRATLLPLTSVPSPSSASRLPSSAARIRAPMPPRHHPQTPTSVAGVPANLQNSAHQRSERREPERSKAEPNP